MNEQNDCRNLKVCASVVVGSLSLGTISTGLFLIYADYICAADFGIGLGAGFLGAATVSSIAACSVRDRFFKSVELSEKSELIVNPPVAKKCNKN